MRNWTSLSPHTPPFRHHALAAALALALLHGAAQAAPTDPLGPAVKLNVGPPEAIGYLDVELNNAGAGVVLWQEKQDDGRYASYFRRFDRAGKLAPLQTYSVTDTLLPITLLKVFDNGEFAVENRSGNQVKITIRNKNGGFARKLWAINCKTAYCRVAMDDEGDIVVVDGADPLPPRNYPYRHIVAQIRDASSRVVKPWFIVDQPAAGVTGTLGPGIAVDADGDFAVAWAASPCYRDYPQPCPGFTRLFDKTGQAKGDQFRMPHLSSQPIMDADGDFLALWAENYSFNPGGPVAGTDYGHTIYSRDGYLVYDGINDSVGYGAGYNGLVQKAVMDDDGDYALLSFYDRQVYEYHFGSLKFQLFGRLSADSLGQRTVTDFNVTYGVIHLHSDIAMDGNGHVAIVWSESGFGTGRFTSGLFLQRFTGPSGESCHGAGATLVGSDGADKLFGTGKDDVIQGKDGDDVIHGRGGNDIICGGRGKDKLYGDAGKDFAEGGPGKDVCVAETTNNCP